MTNLVNTSYDLARRQDPNIRLSRLRIVRYVDAWTARRLTTHFHAISEAVEASAVEHLGIDADRVTVIPRGRDRHRLGQPGAGRAQSVRDSLGVAADTRLLLTVGRQEFQKGHEYLIRAFAAVRDDHPAARLMIAGRQGHMSDRLAALVDELELGESVDLLGHRPDVADLLCAADLFVFPSLYEGLGGALIEASAMGLPIVASDLPALREVVDEYRNASLVPPGDAERLADAIGRLLDDPKTMQAFGDHSLVVFEDRFQLDPLAADLADLLMTVAVNGRI